MVFADRLNSLMTQKAILSHTMSVLAPARNAGKQRTRRRRRRRKKPGKDRQWIGGAPSLARQIGLRLEAIYGCWKILVDRVVIPRVTPDAGFYRNNSNDFLPIKRSDAFFAKRLQRFSLDIYIGVQWERGFQPGERRIRQAETPDHDPFHRGSHTLIPAPSGRHDRQCTAVTFPRWYAGQIRKY